MYPRVILVSALPASLLKFIRASPKKKSAMQASVVVSTILLSLFLYGRCTKMKRASIPETIIKMGTAYMGLAENIPTASAYTIFRK